MRPFLMGFLAAVAVLAGAVLVWQRFDPRLGATQPSARTASATNSLAALVAEESAKLNVTPHTAVLTTDKAWSATEALRRGEYPAAAALAQEVLARSKLGPYAFHPFDTFIDGLSEGDDPDFLSGVNAWIAHSPEAALPYLIRANYYFDTAWLIRGADFDAAVPEQHKLAFLQNLDHAEADVRRSITIDSANPWSYYLLLRIAGSHANPQQRDQVFRDASARFPAYYDLYRIRLHYLQPKWGGSVAEMHDFVNRHADPAPRSSPLKLLYLQLTEDLLNAAWVDCQGYKHEMLTQCINQEMNHSVTPALADKVTEAFGAYRQTGAAEFSAALRPILEGMIDIPGDSTVTSTVLQLAGDAMGSDNQLIHDPGHNNYVLDDITARVWERLDNPLNVEQKYREALADVERMPFPSEDDKSIALGLIYEDMTRFARHTSQYAKVLAYADAGDAVAGVNRGGTRDWKCSAYNKLGHFQEAIADCTHRIEVHRDAADARYDRAQAYERSGNYQAALADYSLIAEDGSSNYLRDGAVIELDHINALHGKYAEEIEIFDRYPFVFDALMQPPDDLAVAYNNRCFAYMKLGDLRKALDDCNMSLKYGRMPDALQKQQQLQKMLTGQST